MPRRANVMKAWTLQVLQQRGYRLLVNGCLAIVAESAALHEHVLLENEIGCGLDQLLIRLTLGSQDGARKVLVKVRVHQAGIGTGDLRLWADGSLQTGHACLELSLLLLVRVQLAHLLRRLHELLLVLVAQLSELVYVLGGADLERHRDGQRCRVRSPKQLAFVEHDTVADGAIH